jgi:hypothetical protein
MLKAVVAHQRVPPGGMLNVPHEKVCTASRSGQGPAWPNAAEPGKFAHAICTLYNEVIRCMKGDTDEALFPERETEGKRHTIINE